MTIHLPTPTPSETLLSSWVLTPQPFAGRSGNSFAEQLRQACLQAIAGFYRARFVLHLAVTIDGDCPKKYRSKVLIAAAEMTVNAIKHGLYERSFGQIEIHLTAFNTGGLCLDIYDNGWGFASPFPEGRGWRLLRALGKLSVHAQAQRLGTLVRLQIDEGSRLTVTDPV